MKPDEPTDRQTDRKRDRPLMMIAVRINVENPTTLSEYCEPRRIQVFNIVFTRRIILNGFHEISYFIGVSLW